MSGIYFEARVDGEQLARDIANINKQLSSMSKTAEQEGAKMDSTFKKLAGLVAGYFTLDFAKNFVSSVATVRGEFQKLEVAFNTMLGNKERADALMAQIVEYAATTPFELQDIAGGAKQLLAYGTEAENVIPIIKQLGDVSAGLGQPLGRLVTVFGQIQLKGKLMGDDLRQINEAGVPLIAELAKNLGKTESEIQAMVTASQIGAEDVAKAFETMSGAGGKFAGMTDAMSKTIAGQISNLKDAWTQMLNNIGQNNEGLIAGTLNTAKSIVDNYQEIIDVLKVLVAAYGSYKAVIIATQAIQSTGAAIQAIQSMIKAKEAITAATLAQRGFNKAAMINPYVAAVAGIIALVTALKTLYDRSQDVKGNIEELSASIEDVGKQDATTELVARYEELNTKTEKTKEEQEELKRIIIALGKEFPGLITGVDAYGNAISLNTEKLIAQNDELRKQKKLLLEGNLEDAEEKRTKLLREQERLQKMLSTGKLVGTDLSVQKWYSLSESQMKNYREELIKITDDLGKLQDKIDEGNQAVSGIKSIDAIKLLAPYKELFTNVDGLTDAKAKELKGKLEGLLSNPLVAGSKEATAKVKDQVDKIAAYLSGDTFTEKVKKAGEQLKIEQAKLIELKETRASDDVINKQKDKIAELEKFIKSSNEKVSASDKKAAKDAKDAAEDRIKLTEEIADREIEITNNNTAAKIAAMRDGTLKQVAEAQLGYNQELQAIQEFNDKKAKELTKAGFGEDSAEIKQLNAQTAQLRILAEQRLNNEIQAINQDAANKVKEIWQEVNESYISEYDKQILAVKQKSDELARAMIDSGSGIGEATEASLKYKAERMSQIERDATLQKLDDQEELERAQIESDSRLIDNEEEKQKALLRLTIKYGKQRLAILKASAKAEDKQQAALLEESINKANNDLENSTKQGPIKVARELVDIYFQAADAVGIIDEEAGKLLESMGQIASASITFAESLAKKDAFGIISSGLSILTSVLDLIAGQKKSVDDLNKNLRDTAAIFDAIASSKDKMNQTDWVKYTDFQIDNAKKIMQEYKSITDSWLPVDTRTSLTKVLDFYKIISDKNKGLTDEQQESLDRFIKAYDDYYDLLREKQEKIIGTTTDDIAQSIIDGFAEGLDSAEDFTDNFESMMKRAMQNVFKEMLLQGPAMKAFVDQFTDAMSDNMITPEERESLRAAYNALISYSKETADFFKVLTGIDLITQQDIADKESGNITGAVKGITEETAGIIAGQFMAMRENLLSIRNYVLAMRDQMPAMVESMELFNSGNSLNYIEFAGMRSATEELANYAQNQLVAVNESVTHLAAIEKNTRDISKLNSIDARLEEMNKNIKNL